MSLSHRLILRMLTILLIGFGVQLTTRAQSVLTIDFRSLESAGSGFTNVGPQYIENGFVLDVPTSETSSDFRSPQSGNTDSYTTSTALSITSVGNSARLSQQGSGMFSMTSIRLSELFRPLADPLTVSFTGFFQNGGSTTQSFTLKPAFGFQTFTFNSTFTNLIYIDFGAQTALGYQFDTIMVTPLAAIPEPATLLLTGISLACVAAGAIRKRRLVSRDAACID